MPRADPSRSDYCASRHLLRNLENATELRRNPLTREYFSGAPHRRNPESEQIALARIRDDVRRALARCSEFARVDTHIALGRMHAVLLRCDIDDAPLPTVAAELGLSERQLRRERRAAHAAFAGALRAGRRESRTPAAGCDIAMVRLAEAVELHELGQGRLAQSAFASIASAAPSPAQRIEALCLAAEAQFDALGHAAAAARLAEARTLIVRHARDLDDAAARMAEEHADFVAWLLRWQTSVSAGLSTQPPIVLAATGDDGAGGEPRRALFVRAAAAYATQRWEVGDGIRGRAAVARALEVLPSLHPSRIKERLANFMADANLFGLGMRGEERHRFEAVEKRAASHGHMHVMLAARAERIAAEVVVGVHPTGRICDEILQPFGTLERREMPRTFAWVTQSIAQVEANTSDRVMSAHLTESIVGARTMAALASRHARANAAIDAGHYDDARVLAQGVYSDAEALGNGRMRGAAARNLAAIALGSRKRGEARRYVDEALSMTERFGSASALEHVHKLARKLGVA